MKVSVYKVSLNPLYRHLMGVVLLAMLILTASDAVALTAGETYSITAQKVNSNGSLAAVSASSSAVADSNGKISFSMSNVPDNSSCNFLVVTVRDSTDTVVRRSIAPCPNAGESLPMGVSGLTNSQTDALLAALSSAGTDDPILAVFGFAIVRSTSLTSSELSFMANLANQGINASGGFISYLTSNGVSSAQIASYRRYIVDRLANTSSGYSKMIKDSVDASSATAKLNARGEAASKLLLVLVQAATDAGFLQDRILEAFNAMGSVVMPLMQQGITNGDITAATAQMIDSSIGGSIQKLKADKSIEKYSRALVAVGASGADVTNYETAANTLLNAMLTAFKAFEQVFNGSETNTAISNAESTLNTAMQSAFAQFMTDTAASNSRITTMISNMDSALGVSTGLTVSNFQYYKPGGTTVNWPLTMVILVDWASSIISNGGGMTYTRDTTTIPSNNLWLGSCSNTSYFNQTDCESNGGTWTAARTDFVGQGIPATYAALFGIQQDIEILEFVRWQAQQAAGQDMSAHETLEKNYSNAVAGLASNISGTTDGSTSISSTIKSAIVTLMKSPQF